MYIHNHTHTQHYDIGSGSTRIGRLLAASHSQPNPIVNGRWLAPLMSETGSSSRARLVSPSVIIEKGYWLFGVPILDYNINMPIRAVQKQFDAAITFVSSQV